MQDVFMEKVSNNHCKCDLKKKGKKLIFLVGQHCEKPKPWTFKGIFKTSVTVFRDLNLLAKSPSQPSTGLIMQPAFIQHPKKKHGAR